MLGEWATGENLPDRELPQNKAQVITANEARASLKKATGNLWSSMCFRATSSAEITLCRDPGEARVPGFTSCAPMSKGKDYMRLRVDFSKQK